MTISQPSSSQGPGCAEAQLRPISAASFGRFAYLAFARWRERRRVAADLARLAEAGDYLLADIGLDPKQARQDPETVIDQITRDR